MQINQEVFYIDITENLVRSGTIKGMAFNDSNYLICCISKEDKFIHIESGLVYDTEEEALTQLAIKHPLHLKAEEIKSKAEEELRELRLQVIGEPFNG